MSIGKEVLESMNMKNKEKFIPAYLDCATGNIKSGIVDYDTLARAYNGKDFIVNELWDKGFVIPDDTSIREFECHLVKNGKDEIYYNYSCNFRALKEQVGLDKAIRMWYGLYVEDCFYEYRV